MLFALSSTAFENGGEIPTKYTCSGGDVSPLLRWSNVPVGTKSLALIADDPDAPRGTWTHWVIWNISADADGLREAVPAESELHQEARQGLNDFGRIGYGGPCPPPGKPHRYFFRLYALSRILDVQEGASRQEVELAMKGHILAEAEWMGNFAR